VRLVPPEQPALQAMLVAAAVAVEAFRLQVIRTSLLMQTLSPTAEMELPEAMAALP
jgi:hypothetical protein